MANTFSDTDSVKPMFYVERYRDTSILALPRGIDLEVLWEAAGEGTVEVRQAVCSVHASARYPGAASAPVKASPGMTGVAYTVTDGEAALTETSWKLSGDVTIPAAYQGAPVTSIADDAFEGCTSLRYVSMPWEFRGSDSDNLPFEDASQAIRNRCPNIVAIEGRREESAASTGTEPPWSTGTLARTIFSLAHPSMSYVDFADKRKSDGIVGLFKGYAELRHLDLTGIDTSGEKSLACLFKMPRKIARNAKAGYLF